MNDALLSSQKMDWNTPDDVLELVREVFDGRIGLDPATDVSNPTRAVHIATPVTDGILMQWSKIGLPTFVNPPYGRALSVWAPKIADEGIRGCEVIALVPARTDTRWFQHITTAHALCFWKGRMTFKGAPAPAPFPCVLAYWGPRAERFREVFSEHGWIPGLAA